MLTVEEHANRYCGDDENQLARRIILYIPLPQIQNPGYVPGSG